MVGFRHVSNTLEAYEKEFKQGIRLVSNNQDKFVFENEVPYQMELMSTQARVLTWERAGPDAFTGRSDIIGDSGAPGVIEVSYKRIK